MRDGEVWLLNCHIAPYDHADAHANHDPERERKVLLHRHQIRRLIGKTERAGFTLIPLRIYMKNERVKVELALARGRKIHDNKEAIKKKIAEREIRRAVQR